MTAEVAVMNKMAVALAADSAVTVVSQGGRKIYNTVDKLFMLSKFHPVGIMVYGKADLMNIPWETIIKLYTKKLGCQKFNTLQEYAEQFVTFLDNGNPLFLENEQSDYVYITIVQLFESIKEEIDEKVKSIIYEEEELTKSKYKKVLSEVITNAHKILQKQEKLPSVPDNYEEEIIAKYKEQIETAKKDVFGKLTNSKVLNTKLTQMCGYLFSKNLFPPQLSSGIVIAGFGESEVYPSLVAYLIEGVANNRLKYVQTGTTKISSGMTAAIVPFAQHKMVYTFIEGIHPDYRFFLEGYLETIFDQYSIEIADTMTDLKDEQKKELIKKLNKLSTNVLKDFNNNVLKYRNDKHVNPIINAVAVLPKGELAVMAESLVNLTALRQKISMDDETVGGSIDVAVISKGDGFIWIKQKQYFEQSLNPHFFTNHQIYVKEINHRGESHDQET